MLSVGQSENQRLGICNADYVIGEAEHLPFEDNTFDMVVSRLAFHHFVDADAVFAEMHRVVKAEGKIVVADLLARNGTCREAADQYETLRDPSHIRCLSVEEFKTLAEKRHCAVVHQTITEIPMKIDPWMALTDVPPHIRRKITSDMMDDVSGGAKTGFSPYCKDGEIMFNHQWLLLIAQKY